MALPGIAAAGHTAQALNAANNKANVAAQTTGGKTQTRISRAVTNHAARNAAGTAEERGPGEATEPASAEAHETTGTQAQPTAQAGARLNVFA